MADLTIVESRVLPPFDPTPEEAQMLAQIRARESSGDYSARNPKPGSTAAGAYQFIRPTWQLASQATGAPVYRSAAEAPTAIQDANALHMLRQYGPNSTTTWAASGPYNQAAPATPAAPATSAGLTVVESRPLPSTPPAESSPIAKAGKAFSEGLGIPALLDIIRASDRYGTPQEIAARGDRAKAALQNIVQGIAAEPGRVWGELSRTGASMLKGDPSGTAYHLAGAVPFIGAPAQQVAMDLQHGDPAAAVGHTAALAAPFLVGPAAEATGRGIAATGRGIATAGTVVRGAAGGMAEALPAATEAAVEKSIYGALGGPAGMVAAAKVAAAKELGKGAITGARSALAERAAQAAAVSPAPPGVAATVIETPRLQLPPGPVITPAPADASFVRSVPGMYPTGPNPLRALPPGPARVLEMPQPGAAPTGIEVTPELLDDVARGQIGKPFRKLNAQDQATVVELARRIKESEAPATPAPPAPPPDTSFVRAVPAQYPDVVPPHLRSNAPAETAAMSLRDLMRESGTAPPPEAAPPAEAPIDFAQAARESKTEKLTQLLNQFEIPASDAQRMNAAQWKQLSTAAGVTEPSEVTRALVLKRLADLQRVRKAQ